LQLVQGNIKTGKSKKGSGGVGSVSTKKIGKKNLGFVWKLRGKTTKTKFKGRKRTKSLQEKKNRQIQKRKCGVLKHHKIKQQIETRG